MQSTYYIRRQHDSVVMLRDILDMDRAIFKANLYVAGSFNTAAYEVVRTKDSIIVAIVEQDHSVGYS